MPSAAIGAVGSVAGGIAQGKGAKKAAKVQQQTAQMQINALQDMYQKNKALMQPTYDNGQAAEKRVNTLLGLPGGDGADVQTTLAATPGYKYTVDQALKGINANAYANGMGNSGAALKALQDRAGNLADQNFSTYLNQVSGVADRGANAMNGLVSQGNFTTQAQNTNRQNSADATSANAVFQGQNLAQTLKGVLNAGGFNMGSSYGGGK